MTFHGPDHFRTARDCFTLQEDTHLRTRKHTVWRILLPEDLTAFAEAEINELEEDLGGCPGVDIAEWHQEDNLYAQGRIDPAVLDAWLVGWFDAHLPQIHQALQQAPYEQ